MCASTSMPWGDAKVEERALQVDAAVPTADVPRVAPAIPVPVREVVRRPRVRREDDRDPLRAEPPRPHDERRVTDPTVAGGRAHEVQAARPIAGADDTQQGGPVAVAAPVDPDRARLREAARAHVLLARPTG